MCEGDGDGYVGSAQHGWPRARGSRWHKFNFTTTQKTALVNFLKTLTDTTILTEVKWSNPFQGTLPLKLVSFSAKKNGKATLLQWRTSLEVNVDRFEVERSANDMDFTKIGTLTSWQPASGDYNFTDREPLAAFNYYRLKIIDNDGQFVYSPVVAVESGLGLLVDVFPNPASDNLNVRVESDKEAELQMQVITKEGKLLFLKPLIVQQGVANYPLNIEELQNGSYFLQITDGSSLRRVVKFVKM